MNSAASVLQSSRREALFVALVWIACCIYVCGYAALFGYRKEATPTLVLGMPSWIFWGVIVPWFACTAVTCWYSLFGIRDEDLGEEQGGENAHG